MRPERWLLYVAIRQANADGGAIFGVVRGEGYKRLPADDAHTVGSSARRHIGRSARKASKTIVRAVEGANRMDPHAKRRATAEFSTLSMIAALTKERVVKAAEREDGKPLSLKESVAGVMDLLKRRPKPGVPA